MLILTGTSDKLQVITTAAVALDVAATWIDYASGGVTPGWLASAITTATTTDVIGSPAGSTSRKVKVVSFRNKHASSAQTVTVQIYNGTTAIELIKVTLQAGERLQYIESIGFRVFNADGSEKIGVSQLVTVARKTSDQAHALTSLADIADLTFAIVANATYLLYALLIHQHSATTTGIGFSINGPSSPTSVQGGVQTIGARGAATVGGFASYGLTAYDGGSVNTAVEATATDYVSTLEALIVNGANGGTLAVRVKAEVAATVTVKAGSFAQLTRVA